MSKYKPLWEYVQKRESSPTVLTFDQIQNIIGNPIDHSFLNCKKELAAYGWQVKKISMKDRTVLFEKCENS
ncbi:MAG: hypothetical protein ACI3XR_10615 [Eubacteriales bacterium]